MSEPAHDRIRIEGVLKDDAVLGYQPNATYATATLCFEIHPAKGMPYRVRQFLGTDATLHMTTEAKLVALRRGARVAVYAAGARVQADHGVSALFLIDVTDVHPLPTPATSHEDHHHA
jgi:hypothetical protein